MAVGEMDAVVATVETVEVILRMAAAIILITASIAVWWGLASERLRPYVVWLYVAIATTLTAIWRVTVLAMVFDPPIHEALLAWITPVTAAMYSLGGVSLLSLVYVSARRRRGDG